MNKRILVCAYFAKNVGDDLFLKVMFDRYPHVDWVLLTSKRDYLQIFKDYKNVKIAYTYRNFKCGKSIFNPFLFMHKFSFGRRRYDAIVTIGGSIFMQSQSWKVMLSERKHLMSRINAPRNFILGANFGPFKDKCFLETYRELFATYDDICFRDDYSYDLFSDLENVRVAPDVVLNLQDEKVANINRMIGISTINLKGRKGLSKYTNEYNEMIARLIERYLDAGYQIKLFSFCEEEGDLAGIRAIKGYINPRYMKDITTVCYTGDLDVFLKAFKSCGRIIGTRFHSMILAMIYRQPFYPLIYSEKTNNFLKDLGFINKGCWIKDIGNLKIAEALDLSGFLCMDDRQVLVDASKQFEKLDKFIG